MVFSNSVQFGKAFYKQFGYQLNSRLVQSKENNQILHQSNQKKNEPKLGEIIQYRNRFKAKSNIMVNSMECSKTKITKPKTVFGSTQMRFWTKQTN